MTQVPQEMFERAESLAIAVARGDDEMWSALEAAVDDMRGHDGSGYIDKSWTLLLEVLRNTVEDEPSVADYEDRIERLGQILGTSMGAVPESHQQAFDDLAIEVIASGRLPEVENPGVLLKRDEIVHLFMDASLVKEVPLLERLRVADSGTLVVTSQRTIFVGRTSTLEFPNEKLIAVQDAADGLRLSVSHRPKTSMFTIDHRPRVVAALIRASVLQGEEA